MEIIEEMEQVGRGLYAGTAGYFGASGDMDQAITIRTLVFSGDEYSFQAGAGIVADSVPAKEYQEVLAKSAILRRALELAEGLVMAEFDNVRMLLIDNYDSFTYNLVQAFAALGADVIVHRNDKITVDEALALEPTHLVISPGPGTPDDAGVSLDDDRARSSRVPILGVCLGHQCHRAALRRARSCAPPDPDARQDVDGRPRRQDDLRRVCRQPVRGRSLPFAVRRVPRRRCRPSSNMTAKTDQRRDHGRAAPGAADRRRAVPSESVLTPEGDALMANFLADEAHEQFERSTQCSIACWTANRCPEHEAPTR